jgi:hypothetical protein
MEDGVHKKGSFEGGDPQKRGSFEGGDPQKRGSRKKSLQTFASMSLLQNKFYKNIMLPKKL